jgi:hypothetical protein
VKWQSVSWIACFVWRREQRGCGVIRRRLVAGNEHSRVPNWAHIFTLVSISASNKRISSRIAGKAVELETGAVIPSRIKFINHWSTSLIWVVALCFFCVHHSYFLVLVLWAVTLLMTRWKPVFKRYCVLMGGRRRVIKNKFHQLDCKFYVSLKSCSCFDAWPDWYCQMNSPHPQKTNVDSR